MINARDKILNLEDFDKWKEDQTGSVVLTNGCFDIIHVGHLRCLEYARSLGDSLVVAINADSSVKDLKGEQRPFVPECERAELIAGLGCVDRVVIFSEKRLNKVINEVKPDIYAKGGDYTLETMDQGERRELEACGAEIHFFELIEGKSTTDIVGAILQKNS